MNETQSLANTTVMILAGGKGTRLRSTVPDRPKSLAPVLGRPFIFYLLEQLVQAAARRVVLLVGYRADQVINAVGENYGDLHIRYSLEKSPLGTGGAARAALHLIDSEEVLLMNGDSYCAVDFGELLLYHKQNKADISLSVSWSDETERFGKVVFDAGGRIDAFHEKRFGSGPGWVNSGVYVMDSRLLQAIPQRHSVSLEKQMIPTWMTTQRLYAYRTNSRLYDIGTPDSYDKAGQFMQCQLHATTAPNG